MTQGNKTGNNAVVEHACCKQAMRSIGRTSLGWRGMKTAFNGFGASEVREVAEVLMPSQYCGDRRDPRVLDNVVRLC